MVGRTVACVARPSVFVADTTRRTGAVVGLGCCGIELGGVCSSGVQWCGSCWFVPVRACSGNALRQRFVLRVELQAEWGNLTRKGYPIAGWEVLATATECAIELPLWDSRD